MRVEEGKVRVERKGRVWPLPLYRLSSSSSLSPPSHSMCSVLDQSQDSDSGPKTNKKDQERKNEEGDKEMVCLIPSFHPSSLPSSLFAPPFPLSLSVQWVNLLVATKVVDKNISSPDTILVLTLADTENISTPDTILVLTLADTGSISSPDTILALTLCHDGHVFIY